MRQGMTADEIQQVVYSVKLENDHAKRVANLPAIELADKGINDMRGKVT